MNARLRAQRPSPAAVLAAAAVVLALASAWHSGPHVWRMLNAEYHTYAPYSASERRDALVANISASSEAFEFFAKHVHRGDRVYIQVPITRDASSSLWGAVVAAGSFYLLPAVRTTDLEAATVIVSYQADPSVLGLRYAFQARESPYLSYFVSRPART